MLVDNLKFLEWPDFVKLVATVAAWTEHLNIDAVYLTDLLKGALQIQSGDSSKNAKSKRRLLSYLLSHVVAWCDSCPLLSVKVLQEIHDVSDSMKLQALLPLLDALAKSPSKVMGRLSVNQREAYVAGILSSFQGRELGSVMNAESSEEWETLKELAHTGLRDGMWCSSAVISRHTHYGLIGSAEMSYLLPPVILSVYGVLKQSRRVELCQCLVNISGEASTTVCTDTAHWTSLTAFQTAIREMLSKMIEDSSVASSLLAWIRGSANDVVERPTKRARLERYVESVLFLNVLLMA